MITLILILGVMGPTFNGGDWFAVGGTDNRTLHIGAKILEVEIC